MFENLSDRLGGVFDRLTKQGALTEVPVEGFLSFTQGLTIIGFIFPDAFGALGVAGT